jgi:hypothetical protein
MRRNWPSLSQTLLSERGSRQQLQHAERLAFATADRAGHGQDPQRSAYMLWLQQVLTRGQDQWKAAYVIVCEVAT